MSAGQLAMCSSNACDKACEVDIVLKEGAPWFKACEITKILGYKNGRDAVLKHVKEKYKATREALDSLWSICVAKHFSDVCGVKPRGPILEDNVNLVSLLAGSAAVVG